MQLVPIQRRNIILHVVEYIFITTISNYMVEVHRAQMDKNTNAGIRVFFH